MTNSTRQKITFYYEGHVPSKSNLRGSGSDAARAKRDAVRLYERDIGKLANTAKGRARRRGMRDLRLDGARQVDLLGFNQSGDADNWFKATLDALQGICYHKDDQVSRGSFEKLTPEQSKGKHGLLVVVTWL